MNQQEYARYLLGLMGEEPLEEDDVEEEEIPKEMFYGYFQMYMPSGEGIKATFVPLEDGDVYLQRIVRIYEMLDPKNFEGEYIPGYFHGTSDIDSVAEQTLIGYGEQLVKGLKDLLEAHKDIEGSTEAAYLAGDTEIALLAKGEIDSYRDHYDAEIYEALFEIIGEYKDYNAPIEILDEAYYSIACDYWISYYLQWHRYGLKGDPFSPYFELYKLGYNAVFAGKKLYIGRS